MESEQISVPVFKFTTKKFINGIIIELMDNDPYLNLEVDMWFDSLYVSSIIVPYHACINNDCYIAIFRTTFKPLKSSGTIKIEIKTKLRHNDKIDLKLILK